MGGIENLEKSHSRLFAFRSQLLEAIESASLLSDAKCQILSELTEFELNCRTICIRSASQSDKSAEQILTSKEKTVGALFGQWARFLGIAYQVPDDSAGYAKHIFQNVGMTLQMLDDTLDAPLDHEYHTDNVFLCLAKEHEREWMELTKYFQYLKRTPWKHLDTIWAARHTPHTLQATWELAQTYLSKINGPSPVIYDLKWVLEHMWDHPIGV